MGEPVLKHTGLSGVADHSDLLRPGKIGVMELRNRIFVTAMGVSLAEENGQVGERLIEYHAEQARGGAALIVTGVMGVAWPVGAVQANQAAISDDCFLPGLRRLTQAVHGHGARIAAQLHHGGLNAFSAAQGGHAFWAPSMPKAFDGSFLDMLLPEETAAAEGVEFVYKVLDRDDIAEAVALYARAAVRAKAAGFDGIEVHAGHGYLLSSFLSPSTNYRQDEYGGPLENRARLTLEVVRAVRAAVGCNFPVWVKIDAREVGKHDGITPADAVRLAQLLEAVGVDALTVTAYHDMNQGELHASSHTPHEPETNIPLAAQIKSAVSIPVIASGRVEAAVASARIGEGKFDFLAMGRKLLADPALPVKLQQGRVLDVRPCIYCYTCVSTGYSGKQVRCAVRPETGFEYRQSEATPTAGQHFVVIGGGPAGMEVSRRLVDAGNRVTLLERDARLGGTLRFAALAYAPNEALLKWLRRGIEAADVDVRLRTAATPELIHSLRPDHVIIATGAVRSMPPLEGADLPHVLSGDDLRQLMLGESRAVGSAKIGAWTTMLAKIGAWTGLSGNLGVVRSLTRYWMPFGRRVVILGGELVGLELAEYLLERGREVTVIEEGEKLGRGLTLVRRMRLIAELRNHGAMLVVGASDVSIDPREVLFTDGCGKASRVAADHVIVAKGAVGSSALADRLRRDGLAVTEIGDGLGVGFIEGAIRGAARAVLGDQAIPQI